MRSGSRLSGSYASAPATKPLSERNPVTCAAHVAAAIIALGLVRVSADQRPISLSPYNRPRRRSRRDDWMVVVAVRWGLFHLAFPVTGR